jgi:hypothetical protein
VISEPVVEKYLRRATPIIAKAMLRATIDQMFDFRKP